MTHFIREIDGMEHAELLHLMNGFEPERFPKLKSRHLSHGLWWIAQEIETNIAIAFAGMVPFFESCDGVGYLKRAYVLPQYRGQGLQREFLRIREERARQIGWHLLVSECRNNPPSQKNFLLAGYETFTPEQPWGEHGSIYFRKRL